MFVQRNGGFSFGFSPTRKASLASPSFQHARLIRALAVNSSNSSSSGGGGVWPVWCSFIGGCVVATSAALIPLYPPAALATTASQQLQPTAASLSLGVSEQAMPHGIAEWGALASEGRDAPEILSEVASEAEDKLLGVIRQINANLDRAVDTVGSNLPFFPSAGEQQDVIQAQAESLINEVWEVVDQNYLDARNYGFDPKRWAAIRDEALARKYNSTDSVYRSVRAMMEQGVRDPYCRFLTPSELGAMKKYDVTGVGLNLGTSKEYAYKTGKPLPPGREATDSGIFVVGLSRGSAADQVGVRQGDEIVEIEGESTFNLSPFQVASRIQGSDGASSSDSVTLKVRHVDSLTEEEVQVARKRQPSPPSPVTSYLSIKGNPPQLTGIIKLTTFNARAQSELASAIRQLEEGGAERLELDLTDNRGGLVTEGVEVARLFLREGDPIVTSESRALSKDVRRAEGRPLTDKPLLVKVNDHTASASEIVAGALRDNCRAVLSGKTTYGKGLIQSVYELSDGSGMVVTAGKYLTPSGRSIDRVGIQPDFAGEPSAKQFNQVVDACLLKK